MIMLREYLPSEFSVALGETSLIPDLLVVHYTIKNFLHAESGSHLRVFGYPFEKSVFWFCLLERKFDCPIIVLARDSRIFDASAYVGPLTQFLQEISPALASLSAPSILTIAELCLNYQLLELLPKFLPTYSSASRDVHQLFYMNEAQIRRLSELEISLPYGYSFEDINIEEDCSLIHTTYTHAKTLESTKSRLESLPSVVIRHDGKTVTYELGSPIGSFSFLYTDPDHRRQGLGSSAELKLAQQVASAGETPFKIVPTYNNSVTRSSEDSPFWTLFNRNGTPVHFVFQSLDL